MTQEELIRKCIRRNRRAQYVFYKTHFSALYRICFRYMRNEADAMDMVNLGFARIMLKLKSFDANQSLEKWMKSVVINTIIDEFRKTKNYRERTALVEEHTLTYLSQPTESAFDGEALELIRLKLKELPEMTRKVFNLYAIDGYKHKEIAEMLSIPEGTSHWHYSNARKTLRTFLQGELNIKAS